MDSQPNNLPTDVPVYTLLVDQSQVNTLPITDPNTALALGAVKVFTPILINSVNPTATINTNNAILPANIILTPVNPPINLPVSSVQPVPVQKPTHILVSAVDKKPSDGEVKPPVRILQQFKLGDRTVFANILNVPIKRPAQESVLQNSDPGPSQVKAGTEDNLGKPPILAGTCGGSDPPQSHAMDLSAKKTAVPIQNEPIQFKKKWEIPEKKPKNLESMLDPTRIIDLTDGEDPVKQPENITPKYPLLHSDPMFSVTNIFDKKVKLPDHNLPNISNEPVKKPAQESLLRNNNPGGSQAKAGTTGNLGKPGSGPIDLSTKKTADPIQNQNCQFTKDSAGFNAPPKRQGHNNAPTSSQVKAEAMLNGIYGWSVDEIAKAINEIPENLEEPPADAAVFNEIMGMVLTPIPVSQKLVS